MAPSAVLVYLERRLVHPRAIVKPIGGTDVCVELSGFGSEWKENGQNAKKAEP